MSRDVDVLVDRAIKAVQIAQDDFRALHIAVEGRSDAWLLTDIGANLDGLALKLLSLFTSTTALSSVVAHHVFDTEISSGVKLSHGIVDDVKAIAGRLRSSNSSEPEMIMDKREGGNILSIIKRYDGAISAILNYHQLYVERMVFATILC
jgi:hypothetical protein